LLFSFFVLLSFCKNPENLAIFGVFNFLPTLPVYIAT